MHANLNKTASKTLLLLLLPKDEGKARKPRTFLHNLLKIRGAQTMERQGAREGRGYRIPKEHTERQNCMKCVSILPCSIVLPAPSISISRSTSCLPARPRHYPLACVHLFFICMNFSLFSQTQSANGANCTSRSVGSGQTRDICQWEISSKINLQHRQSLPTHSPTSFLPAIPSHRDIHNVTVPIVHDVSQKRLLWLNSKSKQIFYFYNAEKSISASIFLSFSQPCKIKCKQIFMQFVVTCRPSRKEKTEIDGVRRE